MVVNFNDRYAELWFSSPVKSGTEEAAGEVMTALLAPFPYVEVLERFGQASDAQVLAEAQNDAAAYLFYEEKLMVFRQFLADYPT